ncbi:MAG: hypothetical protein K5945_02160 [Bacteroidaceae bacterium]|nr:hypothetical protein [Bacteroidaceae bacterium]
MKQKIYIILALLFTAVGANAQDWSGSGTEGSPYIIDTREKLDMLATSVNNGQGYQDKFFRLDNDINYSGYTYTAIGTEANPFCGTFDGNGNSIKSPQIQLASTPYQGIFGYNNGIIKNLKVTDPYILGGDCTGGIAGYNAGVIENCRVDNQRGILYGENDHSCYGGIVGYNVYGGNVGYCLYLGRIVDGTEFVGAIAGKNNEGALSSNLYHHNGYQTISNDNVGTTVLGVGVASSITGADSDAAKKAK